MHVPAARLHVVGHAGDTWTTLKVPSAAASEPAPAAATASDRSSAPQRGVEGLHPLGREVAGHGESLVPSEVACGSGQRRQPRRGPPGAVADQPAEASSAVFLERPVILRPSQATGS